MATGGDHEWVQIRLGRVCAKCFVVQENGRFDDNVPCVPPLDRETPHKAA